MTMAVEEDVQMHLLHLPATVLVAVLNCLGDAAEVMRTALACKALWHVANNALFNKIHMIRFHCHHIELQHVIPRLVQQFPKIHHLSLNSCSALPESWLQPMCAWPVQTLNVSNMWHWDGTRSACLLSWAPSLTHLIADGSNLPISAAVRHAAAAAVARQATAATALHTGTANSASTAAAPAAGGDSSYAPAASEGDATLSRQQQLLLYEHIQSAWQPTIGTPIRQEPPLQQQQQLWGHSLAQWPAWTGRLQQLQLRRLLVGNPIRCQTHGSSDCSCLDETLLSQLLMLNPELTNLDLSHNPMLPNRLLHWTSTSTALQTLNLSGCELLRPGYIATCCPGLRDLDVSCTDAGDADVALVASGLSQLSCLNLNGCKKVTDFGISALAGSHAVLTGQLQHLDVGGLTRTTAQAMMQLLAALAKAGSSSAVPLFNAVLKSCDHWRGNSEVHARSCRSADNSNIPLRTEVEAEGCSTASDSNSSSSDWKRFKPALLHLSLSRTSGVNDAALNALLTAATRGGDDEHDGGLHLADTFQVSLQLRDMSCVGAAAAQPPCPRVPRVGLCGLELAGCNNISGFVLQQLARLGSLSGLTTLDLSDVEALRQPSGSWNMGANVVAVAGRHAATWAAAAESALGKQQQEGVTAAVAAAVGHEHKPWQFEGNTLLARTAAATGHSVRKTAATSAVPVPQSVLCGLFSYSGSMLASLTLDGCHVDDATAAFIGVRCPQLRLLSLVGCRGLQSAGLSALLQRCSSSLKCLQLGGSHSRWRESESLAGITGLTEFRLLRRSLVRNAELAPILAANTGLKSLALVGCYSCTDQLFVLATASDVEPGGARHAGNSNDASSGSNVCLQPQPALQQHLTQLVLTACDGITGSSLPRLHSLRHLRVSYCASFSIAAVQQIVLSCTKLMSLELPAQLQQQLAMQGGALNALNDSITAGDASRSSSWRHDAQIGAENNHSSSSAAARRFSQVKPVRSGSGPAGMHGSGVGWSAGARDDHGQVVPCGAGLPQQGSGGHLQGLMIKVVGI